MMADSFEYNNYSNGQDFSESMETDAVNGEGKTTGEKINASKNDDDERKLFVGGLSWETTLKDIKDYFGKYGDIVDATLKTDPTTGRSRGFGFILYSESTAVDKVLEAKSHTLHGRTIDPKRAKARGGREPILKVFVGGLDPVVPESEIREYFEKYGKVVEIDLPYDKAKGQRRAFCFVTFESEAIVDEVCKQAKQTIPGKQEKPVDVKKATPKNEQGGWGYGGGWGGGYGGGYGGGFGGGRGGGRGRGRGRGRGGYNQGWGDYGGYGNDYYGGGQNGYGGGYGGDYGGYGGGYGNYDYNNYYGNQGGWGGYSSGGGGYGGGYGGNNYGGQQGGYGKAKSRGGGGSGYHPYSR